MSEARRGRTSPRAAYSSPAAKINSCDPPLFLLNREQALLIIAGEFTTSLGDAYPYTISAITTDSAGNTYVVGSRQLGTPPAVVFDLEYIPPNSDVFVTKLDPTGKLLFTDTFAGKGTDTGNAIAVDPTGNIYIAGTTTSPDFPLSKALQTQPSAPPTEPASSSS